MLYYIIVTIKIELIVWGLESKIFYNWKIRSEFYYLTMMHSLHVKGLDWMFKLSN